MTSHGEIKTVKRNVLPIPHLCLYSRKDFQQDVGHSSDMGQKHCGVPITKKVQEENEIECCLEERSETKEVEIYLYISVPMVVRLKLFFAQPFLSISSVFTEQSQICVKSTVSAKLAQGDLL